MRKHFLTLAGLVVALLAVAVPPDPVYAQNSLPPVAIATLEIATEATETTPAVVALDGSESFDPDAGGSLVRYEWEILTEAYQWLEIEQANRQSPTATVELPGEKLIQRLGYSIEFRLTVTDSGRPAATDSVVVKLEISQPPVINVEVSAKLLDRDDESGYDDNRNGVVDENSERYTIEGVVSGPGERGNAENEWRIRARSLLTIDASGTFDPDGELTEENFTWERLFTSDVPTVTSSLPGNTEGEMILSTDEDPNTPSRSGETVAVLPVSRRDEPYIVFYRLTVTDEDDYSVTRIIKIVIQDFHNDPEVEIGHPESDPGASSADDRREGVLPAGEDRYVISVEAAEDGVTLTAMGEGDGSTRTSQLTHRWSGTGVEPSDSNEPGSRSEAEFTAPEGTVEGDSFTVEVEVVDPEGYHGSHSVELVVVDTTAPTASAPDDIETFDGVNGGFPVEDPPTGVVLLYGIAFDADGDVLVYQWAQVLNADGEELPARWTGVRLLLEDSTSLTASFRPPEVVRGTSSTVYVKFQVTDTWGVTASDVVRIVIYDGNDDLRAAAGANQQVLPGSFVRLIGNISYGKVSDDALDQVTYQWAYKGIETDPPTGQRPSISLLEQAQGLVAGGWLANADGTYHPTAGGRLKNPDRPFAYFDAPELSDFNGIKLVFDLTVAYRNEEDTDTVAVTVLKASGLRYYSGVIDGFDYCTNRSLGGPPAYPFDSDGDGIADVCAIRETRRAAVARQHALGQLADLNRDLFYDALFGMRDDPRTASVDESTAGSCASAPTDLGDTEEQMAEDACGRRTRDSHDVSDASPVPDPVNAASAHQFYSGSINSPQFCTNHSLGGPTTYPFDSDDDGIADVCALPYTRREAVARHNALRAAFNDHPQFPAALAFACASLGSLNFGDTPTALAQDHCSRPPTTEQKGQPLP